jgi:hypothetical protein
MTWPRSDELTAALEQAVVIDTQASRPSFLRLVIDNTKESAHV